MSNCIDRFRDRIVVAPSFEVKVGDVTLVCSRVSQVETDAAWRNARKLLRTEGLEPTTADNDQATEAFCCTFPDVLKKYVIRWKFADGVKPIQFSSTNVSALIDEMGREERVLLTLGYHAAMRADEKKRAESAPPSIESGLPEPSESE